MSVYIRACVEFCFFPVSSLREALIGGLVEALFCEFVFELLVVRKILCSVLLEESMCWNFIRVPNIPESAIRACAMQQQCM